ncbi:DUF6870 family protein [[Clostridium] hylemonae]|uniref:DUF6870 family protein n=1 Tax=[Clostridium] hylemonae TaxID=89153 RepID=UPI001FCBDF4D|nr:hypothetical protein [[Clostridium] hylemonae]BDF03549.1 hypothetical protein CE91St63_06110 [[Clostridium] hylemonae]
MQTETAIHNSNDSLADIRDITVDKELPREERIAEFVRQIKNPYRFRCGRFIVKVSFAGNGVTLEDCIRGIFSAMKGVFLYAGL